MKTFHSLTYIICITALGLALSCGGSGTAMGEGSTPTMGNASEMRTSSDMNISPANMNAQDPMYRKNDTLTPAKDSIAPLIPND